MLCWGGILDQAGSWDDDDVDSDGHALGFVVRVISAKVLQGPGYINKRQRRNEADEEGLVLSALAGAFAFIAL